MRFVFTENQQIAAVLYAAEEGITLLSACKALDAGQRAEHYGDCTKVAQSCIRCMHDDLVAKAETMKRHLDTFGLKIVKT